MKGNVLSDLVFWSFVVGLSLVLTRPGSQGPALVTNLTNGYAGIVRASTGSNITS